MHLDLLNWDTTLCTNRGKAGRGLKGFSWSTFVGEFTVQRRNGATLNAEEDGKLEEHITVHTLCSLGKLKLML